MTAWSDHVSRLLRDEATIDADLLRVQDTGIVPALAQYAIDQPRTTAVDLAPTDRWLPLPSTAQGWVDGFSRVVRIDAPAGETPPATLADWQWCFQRDPATPATMRILLPYELDAGDTARVEYTSTWPTPNATAATDLLSDVAFSAVTSLAAALVCTSMATEAARNRHGAIATDWGEGTDRARNLLDAASALRIVYNTFVGLGALNGAGTPDRVLRSTRYS